MNRQQAFIPYNPQAINISKSNYLSSCPLRPSHSTNASSSRSIITSCTPPPSSSSSSPSFTPVPLAPIQSDVWELDFYSRPVVGLDGKKLWELIIVDSLNTFEFIEPVPNSLVNSKELRNRIQLAIETSTKKPRIIKFFRAQMQNMIQIALSDFAAEISIVPTRKTYALYNLLQYRQANVYPSMPGFKPSLLPTSSNKANVSIESFGFSMAKRLPDALRCEKFAFGNFPLGDLLEFFNQADANQFYGDAVPVDLEDKSINANLSKDVLIPGIIGFSKRGASLSAWINGIELVFIKVKLQQRLVIFECGLNTAYQFANIKDDIKGDCKEFQSLKQNASGLHFFAIQESPESEEIEGMWLLSEPI